MKTTLAIMTCLIFTSFAAAQDDGPTLEQTVEWLSERLTSKYDTINMFPGDRTGDLFYVWGERTTTVSTDGNVLITGTRTVSGSAGTNTVDDSWSFNLKYMLPDSLKVALMPTTGAHNSTSYYSVQFSLRVNGKMSYKSLNFLSDEDASKVGGALSRACYLLGGKGDLF